MGRITVMSAGNGGQALAGDLAIRGHDVTLYEHPLFESKIKAIRERGNVIELENKVAGRGRLANSTTDAAEALAEAELVYFTAPSYAQEPFFELALSHFRDGQVLVLSPGNFGTFALHRAFTEAGKRVIVAETDNLPYACVSPEPGRVDVKGVKKSVTLAALPNSEYARVEAAVKGAFCTAVVRGGNVLQTSLSNTNSIVHCGPMLMNAGRIEGGNAKFRFYAEGMPHSVCRVMEAADCERVAVGVGEPLEAGDDVAVEPGAGVLVDRVGGDPLRAGGDADGVVRGEAAHGARGVGAVAVVVDGEGGTGAQHVEPARGRRRVRPAPARRERR